MNFQFRGGKYQTGVGFLEIMIALILISMGFLATAKMQVEALRFSQSGYFRSQAYLIANDIIDRMRSNLPGVNQGHYTSDDEITSTTDCSTTACDPEQIAQNDLVQWRQSINPPDSRTILPGYGEDTASGSIAFHGDNEYTVTITWFDGDTMESLEVGFIAQNIAGDS